MAGKPVSIPSTGADEVYDESGREGFLLIVRQYLTGLLQKRSFSGEVSVGSTELALGYVDVVFSGSRIDASYVPEAFIVMSDGTKVVADVLWSSIAATGFRVYVAELGTLYWKVIPYE
jgi:hypothetical protein